MSAQSKPGVLAVLSSLINGDEIDTDVELMKVRVIVSQLAVAADTALTRLQGMNQTGVIAKDNPIVAEHLRAALAAFRGDA